MWLLLYAGSPAQAQIEADAFITDAVDGTVSVFNPATQTSVGTAIKVGTFPEGVATTPDGRFVYVTNLAGNSVSVIDTASRTVVGAPIAVGTNPVGIAVSPDGHFAYVTNSGGNTVSVIDTSTNKVVGQPIAVGANPSGIAVSLDGKTAYVTLQNGNSVAVIDTTTDKLVGSPIAVGKTPTSVALTPDGKFAFVTNSGSNTVSIIDTTADKVVGMPVAVGSNPLSITLTPDGKTALVTNTNDGTVSLVDTGSDKVTSTIKIGTGTSPFGIAVTPDGKRAVVTNPGTNNISVINLTTGTVIGSFKAGNIPLAFGAFIGPNVIVAPGGPLSVSNDTALTGLGFGQFVDFNGGTLRTTGSLTTSRTLSLLAGGGTIDTNGFNSVLTGSIINSGNLTKTGAGTLTLNAVESFTGSTLVTGGTLMVGDAQHQTASLAGGVTVMSGGTLAGHGVINGLVTNQGGTVAPGGPTGMLGILTASGGFKQGTGTLAIEIAPAINSELKVTGNATLSGTVMLLPDGGSYVSGKSYAILATTGTLTTSNLTVSGVPKGFTAALTEIGNDQLDVTLTAVKPPSTPPSVTPPVTPPALPDSRGQIYADFLDIGRDDFRGFLTDLSDEIDHPSPHERPTLVWGHALGGIETIRSDANASGLSATTGGGILGLEHAFNTTRLGLSLDYRHTDLSLDTLDQHGHFDSAGAGLYGEQFLSGPLFLDGAAGISYERGDATRTVITNGAFPRAAGDFDGFAGGALTRLGARFHSANGLTLEPSATLLYTHIDQGSARESGAAASDLATGARTRDEFQSRIGGDLAYQLGAWKPDLQLAWAHDFSNTTPALAASFTATPASSFLLTGANPGRDAALVGAGILYEAGSQLTLYARYDGSLAA
ncbi:MAG TPA: autotransporter domain-containing protein, partial [Stellaceae bacterium]|nr:autotransporter domain-containing protein [Stellaceae bacterium]